MKELIAAAMVLLALGVATSDAREPTVSDFAICNREAAEATGTAPLASPGYPVPAGKPRGSGPDRDAASAVVGPGYRTEAGRTDPTGSLIARPDDPLLRGMAAEHAADDDYRAAYRKCMDHRGVGPGRAPGQ